MHSRIECMGGALDQRTGWGLGKCTVHLFVPRNPRQRAMGAAIVYERPIGVDSSALFAGFGGVTALKR